MGIPINPDFAQGVVRAETAPAMVIQPGLRLQVVGPTLKNLENLRKKWLKWLEDNQAKLETVAPRVAVAADRSIPNLSSIMVLAEESGRKLLLTGDGRGSDLLQGLKQAGLLDAQGRLHVDVLKMPHHGSARNMTRRFLEKVTADRYVICANGRDGNPDYPVLTWLVETAQAHGRKIEILLTNATPSSEKLLKNYDPQEYGYTLTILDPQAHELVVEIALGGRILGYWAFTHSNPSRSETRSPPGLFCFLELLQVRQKRL